MFQSKDKLLNIEVANTPDGYILQPADWAWLKIPTSTAHAQVMAQQLANMASDKTLTLLTPQEKCTVHKHDAILHSIANVSVFRGNGLKFTDAVNVLYEGTIKKNCTKFTARSEVGFLFARNMVPAYRNTSWFANGYTNATTGWNVEKHKFDEQCVEPVIRTKWGNFSWEIGILMIGLALPLQTFTFLYEGNPDDASLLSFVKVVGCRCYCYTNDAQQAAAAIALYDSPNFSEHMRDRLRKHVERGSWSDRLPECVQDEHSESDSDE